MLRSALPESREISAPARAEVVHGEGNRVPVREEKIPGKRASAPVIPEAAAANLLRENSRQVRAGSHLRMPRRAGTGMIPGNRLAAGGVRRDNFRHNGN